MEEGRRKRDADQESGDIRGAMGKLFNLKEWLTVADAAQHLSIAFGEDVGEADVLRLALDGHLRLSVNFVNHTRARCGEVVGYEDAKWSEFPAELAATFPNIPNEAKGMPLPYMTSLNIDGKRFLNLSDELTTLRGVWDLPMIGNEKLDVEHEYQNLTAGPAVTLQGLDGAFVEGSDGQICQLQESFEENEYQPGSIAQLEKLKEHIASNDIKSAEAESLLSRHKEQRKEFLEKQRATPAKANYYPAGGLPKDAVIVVRTEALREFEQTVTGEPNGTRKPIGTSERKSLLTIIAALCDYSAIEPQERGAASQIAKLTEDIGVAISDDTVRRWLKAIPDALEARKK